MPIIASAVDKQEYENPSTFPEAFTWIMERFDVCNPNFATAYINESHTQTGIVVTWDPNYVNTSGYYGRLYIENFFTNDSITTCNIDFCNLDNRNFVWSNDGKKLYFSFQSFEIGSILTKPFNWTSYKTAYLASTGQSGSYEYWAYDKRYNNPSHARYAAYGYYGQTPVEFELDLEEKTIMTTSNWGIFMATGSGTAPGTTRVFNYYTQSTFYSTDLVDIINDKDEGDEVTVADDLLAVAFLNQFKYDNNGNKTQIGSVIVAKDLGKYKNKNVNTANAFDYMLETGQFSNYDQSNWVVLTSDDFDSNSSSYVGHILKGGTVKGTFTDKLNPTIALSNMPTMGNTMSYTPNVYVVPSFNDAYAAVGSEYFFVQPKPQEYCEVKWANYDATTDAFYTPTSSGSNNTHNLSGGFLWDKTYLDSGSGIDGTVYTFNAMVNMVPPESESYNVWVHAINGGSQLVTDDKNYIYAIVNGEKVFGERPGKRLTQMRQAYDSGGTPSNWYYISFGTTKPDLIAFSREGGSNQTSDITYFEKANNFYNYWMDGYGDKYERLSGCYVTSPSSRAPRRETATPDVNSGVSTRYVVMPLTLDASSVVTGIDTVNCDKTIVRVIYYNPMGMASQRPFNGMNIVVKQYSDGSINTTKIIR